MNHDPRLTRSETDRMLAGVCGGLGKHLGIDPTLVRVIFVLLAVFGGSGILIYLALWLIVPNASKADAPPRDVVRDGVEEGRHLASEGAQAARRGYRRMRGESPDAEEPPDATPDGPARPPEPPRGS